MSTPTCSNADFPFSFFDANLTFVNGTLSEGSCIFPNANCNDVTPTRECCVANMDVVPGIVVGTIVIQVVGMLIFFPMYYAHKSLGRSATPEEASQLSKNEEDRKPVFGTWVPHFVKKGVLILRELGPTFDQIGGFTTYCLTRQTQQVFMSVLDRNRLQSAEAFMDPLFMVFGLGEEIFMVRMVYAYLQKDKALVNGLAHFALASVIVTGVFVGLSGTILGVIEPALEVLTNSGRTNDEALYPGCSLIENVDTSAIIPYWLMKSWTCLGTQLRLVMFGVLWGASEWKLMSWFSVIGYAVFAVIWFGGNATFTYPYNPLTFMGLADLASEWIVPLSLLGYLASPIGKRTRERIGFEFSAEKVYASLLMPFRKDTRDARIWGECVVLLKQGMKVMVSAITIQLCTTCSIYMAQYSDSAVAYQITALESRLPIYVISWIVVPCYIVKFLSPHFLSRKRTHDIFVRYAKLNLLAVVLLAAGIFGATINYREDLAFKSGTNACEFASSSECLPYFNKIFGENASEGPFTLVGTYDIFPFIASIEVALMMLRAILVACNDFDAMVFASVAAAISYIPAILIVQFEGFGFEQQAIGYIGAAYIPKFVMVLFVLGRLAVILPRISRGQPGPWSQLEVEWALPSAPEKDATASTTVDKKMEDDRMAAAE